MATPSRSTSRLRVRNRQSECRDPVSRGRVFRHKVAQGAAVKIGQVRSRRWKPEQERESAGRNKSSNGTAMAVSQSKAAKPKQPAETEDLGPSVRQWTKRDDPRTLKGTGPRRIVKEDAEAVVRPNPRQPLRASTDGISKPPTGPAHATNEKGERRVPMSKIRKKIAERLVQAQQTAAILTTFNEVDMSAIIDIRAKYKEHFQEVHGVGLGLHELLRQGGRARASQNSRASTRNSTATTVVYHSYVHLGIAVSTDRGLAVPVLRNVEQMSFAKIESEINASPTPRATASSACRNSPAARSPSPTAASSARSSPRRSSTRRKAASSACTAIQKRPVAINDKVEIRPMMYVALSYDHRLVDGESR